MDTSGALLFFLAGLIVWAGITRSKRQKDLTAFAARHGCKPPQKHLHNLWWPPLGLDKTLPTIKADRAGRLPAFMLQEFEKHGHTYTQQLPGQYVILTRSPANVEAVCKTRFKEYEIGADRAGNFRPLIGHGILALDGREWVKSRAMLRNTDHDFTQLETHVQHLLGRLTAASQGNEVVEISELLLKLSTDFATMAIFGRSTDSLLFGRQELSAERGEGSAAEFSEAANNAIHMLGQRGLLINLYWIVDSPRFRKSCRIVKRFVDGYLSEAGQSQERVSTRSKAGKEDYTSSVSFMQSLVSRDQASPEVIRDQLLALLLASRDTSASFAAWVLYALARSPRVMAKLRGLIKARVRGGRPPTVADITALAYLRHVLNETLRIFPVVPLDGRTSKTHTWLPEGGGVEGRDPLLVPAGAKVAFNIYAMHHRRDIFGDDADEFRPERWEEDARGARADFEAAFVPFITGPRICLGKNMAMMTVSYVVIRILQTFDTIDPAAAPASTVLGRNPARWPSEETRYQMEDGETTFKIGVTMSPRDGVWVKLQPATLNP
ncbi:Cytochrome P450 [Cladophialophora carrionii]|uniref:Cytochrome P450 n=1 Tax=Cladophialophora carrionii TaxID=86049 RepID=A0A1C1CUX4_9EURO|nr:Cytochrome P450 [Cladophialophora carrionii]